MALQDRYNMDLIRNEAQELVYKRIEGLLEKGRNLCPCEVCVLDLVAFTLNRITPRYSTSLVGDLHPDRVRQKRLKVEIDLALRAGLDRLSANPHHDWES